MVIDKALTVLEKDLQNKGRSKYTIISYMTDLQQLIACLKENGIKNIEDVKAENLENYKKVMLKNEEFSVKSVSRKVNSIRLLFKCLFSEGIVSENIAENLTHPYFKNADPKVLQPVEYRAIRDASMSDPRLYSVVEVLLQTGIRVGELVRLKKDDLFQEGGKWFFRITKYQSQPERIVPVNEKAYNALQTWLKVRPNVGTDYIYVTRNAKPIIVRNLRTSLLRVFKKAGVTKGTVNDFRNTFIAYYLAKGVSRENVAQLVGHRNLTTTDRYKDLLPKEEKVTSEKPIVL